MCIRDRGIYLVLGIALAFRLEAAGQCSGGDFHGIVAAVHEAAHQGQTGAALAGKQLAMDGFGQLMVQPRPHVLEGGQGQAGEGGAGLPLIGLELQHLGLSLIHI